MQTLNVQQAAALLHMNVKRVQGLARTGKLPAVRVGRRWLFDREQLEKLLGLEGKKASPPSLALSARNRLHGRVVELRTDGLMAEVVIRIGDQDLVSIITRNSAERLRLAVGAEVYAVIKSTEIMIGRDTETAS
jgi:molybdopterin-binding protein